MSTKRYACKREKHPWTPFDMSVPRPQPLEAVERRAVSNTTKLTKIFDDRLYSFKPVCPSGEDKLFFFTCAYTIVLASIFLVLSLSYSWARLTWIAPCGINTVLMNWIKNKLKKRFGDPQIADSISVSGSELSHTPSLLLLEFSDFCCCSFCV